MKPAVHGSAGLLLVATGLCLALAGGFVRAETAVAPPAKFRTPAVPGLPAAYRDWKPVSRLVSSGLHWQNRIIVYTNQPERYRQNQHTLQLQQEAESWTASPEAKRAAAASEFHAYDVGTVFIKENHVSQADGSLQPIFLTIMIKREAGFDDTWGDWEYIQSSPTGDVMLRGAGSKQPVQAVCGECHSNVPERDYIFATAGQGSK